MTQHHNECACHAPQHEKVTENTFAPSTPNCTVNDCPFNAIPPKIWEALLPKPFRKRHPLLFWGGIILLALIMWQTLFTTEDTAFLSASEESIAIIRVEGPIMEQKGLLKWIEKIAKNNKVKGVLLRVDSPGGGVGASQEIYEALKKLNSIKPVVASMGSTAASGGLMVSMAAQWVVANPSTVTGSIGVRMDRPQYYKLLEKLGLGQETLTTAPYKDAGSPLRPLTEEDRKYFNTVLQDMHQQFVEIVAEGRHMDIEQAQRLADGKIYTGREALKLGLVDELGGQSTALNKLRAITNLPEDVTLLERPDSTQLWKELMENLLDIQLKNHAAPTFSYQF